METITRGFKASVGGGRSVSGSMVWAWGGDRERIGLSFRAILQEVCAGAHSFLRNDNLLVFSNCHTMHCDRSCSQLPLIPRTPLL